MWIVSNTRKTWGLLASIWDFAVLDYLNLTKYLLNKAHAYAWAPKSLVLGEIYEIVEISKSQVLAECFIIYVFCLLIVFCHRRWLFFVICCCISSLSVSKKMFVSIRNLIAFSSLGHSYWCYFKSLQLSADVAIFLVLGSTRLKSAAKLLLFFDICKDFYKNSAKKLILLQIGILLYRI